MTTSICYRDFSFYYRDNDNKYKEIFDEILAYNSKTVKVLRNTGGTKASLIDTKYGRYVSKVFVLRMKRNERFLKSFIKGGCYQSLIVETDRVRSAGLTFPNDFYLLAERKIFNYVNVFIIPIKYVGDVELNDMPIIPEDVKAEIKALIEKSHALSMLSGDPYQGSFIVGKDGVRTTDFSSKSCTAEREARDHPVMKRHLGTVNGIKDYGCYSVVCKTKLRKLIKKLESKA